MTSAPERGDFIWISFDPRAGHEQAGVRPALVLSPTAYNKRVGLALICPITSQGKGYPFEVSIPEDESVHGFILADQVKSLDWRTRGIRPAGNASPKVLAETLGKLTALLA